MVSEAAEIVARALEDDARAHERGELGELVPRIAAVRRRVLPINDIPRPVFKLALRFWKAWAQVQRHGARYRGPVENSEWPQMARTIAEHVRLGTMPSDRRVIDVFVRRRSSLTWRDLKVLFEKSG